MILIPKTFHRIWLGPAAMPEEFVRYGNTWIDLHPGWEMKHWTEANLTTRYPGLIARCQRTSNASNIYRYELLLEHGGIYIDTDFECRKNIESLIFDEELVTAHQIDDPRSASYYNPAFFGCIPDHPAMAALLAAAPGWNGPTYGPTLFTAVLRNFLPRVLPRKLFYPYSWDELERKDESFPEVYAVHHWGSKTQPFSGSRIIRI